MDRREAYYVDLLQALDLIQAFLSQGKVDSLKTHRSHAMARSAIERQLGIIGEAVNHLRKLDEQHVIPEADRIVAFRNRLIHSYESIEDHFVWNIIEVHPPLLRAVVERHIGETRT